MRPAFLTTLTLALSIAATSALANEGEAADAADAAPQMTFDDKVQACSACHGEKGAQPIAPEYPILAGQHADYLAHAIREYRDGRRQNPIMGSQPAALGLTEADIVGLAKYFSSQPLLHSISK